MAQPSAEQVQMTYETPAGEHEISGSGAMKQLPPEAQQQLYDINIAVAPHLQQVAATGATKAPEPIPELENKQWAFERGEVAQDIQRTNDMATPGE